MDRRLALVTGASAGIGAAFARILGSHGYDLALTARRADRLDKLAEELSLRYGVEALTVAADLAEPEAPGQILDFLTAHGRTVDALVNNAGYGLPGVFADTRWEDQRAVIQVMMTAPAELAHRTLPGQYRRIDPKQARIILIDALDAVLPTFGDHLSTQGLRQLHKLGVEVELGTKVVDVDFSGIEVETKNGRRRIEAMTKMWAAGVAAPALSRQVAERAGAETDRAGRILVNPDCTVPGHPEIFAIGDMMALDKLPGVAQVAIQSGRYAARQIKRRLANEAPEGPFKYFDKGSMATISRFSAVASIGKARFAGFVAWLLWLGVHLLYLVGFKNRLTTVLHWFVSFIGSGRSERVATVQQVFARNALREFGDPPA